MKTLYQAITVDQLDDLPTTHRKRMELLQQVHYEATRAYDRWITHKFEPRMSIPPVIDDTDIAFGNLLDTVKLLLDADEDQRRKESEWLAFMDCEAG